ncbi:hypothetical protein GW764_02290 [Candidatus Parcubacteria bacterium]|nr:hypothetical protein [Candidatus Parcubacteria bacterium]
MTTIEIIFFALFFIWGIPLVKYRSKFRKIVYQTNSWTINIKPYFIKETIALFKNIYPENQEYLKMRNFYRRYLLIYIVLFILVITV